MTMLGLVARSDWFLSHHGAGLEMIGRLDDYTAGSVSSLPLNSPGFLPPPSEGGGGGSTWLRMNQVLLCEMGAFPHIINLIDADPHQGSERHQDMVRRVVRIVSCLVQGNAETTALFRVLYDILLRQINLSKAAPRVNTGNAGGDMDVGNATVNTTMPSPVTTPASSPTVSPVRSAVAGGAVSVAGAVPVAGALR